MLALGFHSRFGKRPQPLCAIDLGPSGVKRLGRPRGACDHEQPRIERRRHESLSALTGLTKGAERLRRVVDFLDAAEVRTLALAF